MSRRDTGENPGRIHCTHCVPIVLLVLIGLGLVSTADVTASTAPTVTPAPRYAPTATPPTQAARGNDLFYLYCMPCHGDRGQGLTDEFRTRVYPAEDAYCWNSGCHGTQPYANGFTIPMTVPTLIGPGTLQRFGTASDLFHFIRRAMPLHAPGSLTEAQSIELTAFLLERNSIVPTGVSLDTASLAGVSLRAAASPPVQDGSPDVLIGLALPVVILIGGLVYITHRLRQSHKPSQK